MIKKLKERHFSKELRLCKVDSKSSFVDKVIDILDNHLPEDINELITFGFNYDRELPLSNGDFHCSYMSLETNEEYAERLVVEKMSDQKKLEQLNLLAKDLNYKVEKIDD